MSNEWDAYEKTWRARFVKNLKELTKNYKLLTLSRKTGISTSNLSRYISGKELPGPWNCIRLARGLGVPITDIIDYFY